MSDALTPENHIRFLEQDGRRIYNNIIDLLDDEGHQHASAEYDYFVNVSVDALYDVLFSQSYNPGNPLPDVDDIHVVLTTIDHEQREHHPHINVNFHVLAHLRKRMLFIIHNNRTVDLDMLHTIIDNIDAILNEYPGYTPDTELRPAQSPLPELLPHLIPEDPHMIALISDFRAVSDIVGPNFNPERFVQQIHDTLSEEMAKEKSKTIIQLLKMLDHTHHHNFQILEHYVEDALDTLPDTNENHEHRAFLKKLDQLLTSAILQIHHDEWAHENTPYITSGGKPKKAKKAKRKKHTKKKRKVKLKKRKKTRTKKKK